MLRRLVRARREVVAAEEIEDSQIEPASLDLRLGPVAWRVRASFLPGPNATVREKLASVALHEISLEEGAVLETHCVYVVPLLESAEFSFRVSGIANPKSSTGRLDVFTRLITDRAPGVRPNRARLSRAALCRDQPAHLSRSRAQRVRGSISCACAAARRSSPTPN